MKQMQGLVHSLAGQKTAIVTVSRQWSHPLYLKSVKRSKNYACHYQDLSLTIGDTVIIQASRSLSKSKHFQVIKKLEK